MIGRFHYLGHTPTSGAQLRYLVTARTGRPIAAISFAGSRSTPGSPDPAGWKTPGGPGSLKHERVSSVG